MFRPILKRSVFVFDIFSVLSVAHSKLQIIYSMLLMMSCVYIFYFTPQIVCTLEGNCDNSISTFLKGIFARVVAVTCMISRFVILLKGKTELEKYNKNMDDFHTFTPMTSSETDRLKKISSRALLCCILLTVPVNTFRLCILINVAKQTVGFVVLVYIQNFSMYCVETHFTVLCYILYQKLVGINNDLMALKIDTIVRNKYPFVSLQTGEKYGKNYNTIEYNRDIFHSLVAGYPKTDLLVNLKAKHKLVYRSVKNLNNMFGIHLGLSLCALCLYALFDIYYHLQEVWNHSKYKVLVYGWILQYFVRFSAITVIAHVTTKQVGTLKDIYSNSIILLSDNISKISSMRIKRICVFVIMVFVHLQ